MHIKYWIEIELYVILLLILEDYILIIDTTIYKTYEL